MFDLETRFILILRFLHVELHSYNSDFLVETNRCNIQLFRGVSSVWMDLGSINKTWMHYLFNEELLIVNVVIQLITPVSFDVLQVPDPN